MRFGSHGGGWQRLKLHEDEQVSLQMWTVLHAVDKYSPLRGKFENLVAIHVKLEVLGSAYQKDVLLTYVYTRHEFKVDQSRSLFIYFEV